MTIETSPTATCATACVLLVLSLASAGAEESSRGLSQAETLLWMTDQLKTIDRPLELTYRFDRTGSFERGFTDTVKFVVNKVMDDGMKSASLAFLTGERRIAVPPVTNTNVNPVLKVYLQGDVYEMNRLTDTNATARERWRYFQRRIKFALADTAKVADVVVSFNGQEYAAQEVSFSPYVNDPNRQSFAKFADKSYTIVVSEELPGYLYRIETIVPGASPEEPPLIKEVLQLVGVADMAGGAKAGL